MQQEFLPASDRRIESEQTPVFADFERIRVFVEWFAFGGITVNEQRHVSVGAAASASLNRLWSEHVSFLQRNPGLVPGRSTDEDFRFSQLLPDEAHTSTSGGARLETLKNSIRAAAYMGKYDYHRLPRGGGDLQKL